MSAVSRLQQWQERVPTLCLSMTTIPPRLHTQRFRKNVEHLCDYRFVHMIVLHIPSTYQRFHHTVTTLPAWLSNHPKIVINRQAPDKGPATKVFGLASWPDRYRINVSDRLLLVGIVDDDIFYKDATFRGLGPLWHPDSVVSNISYENMCGFGANTGMTEVAGYGGWFIRSTDLLRVLDDWLVLYERYRRDCLVVDDVLLSYCMRKTGFTIYRRHLDLEDVIDIQESDDTEENWPELRTGTVREMETAGCCTALHML